MITPVSYTHLDVYKRQVVGEADEAVGAAIRLRALGLEPVPHIAVRNFSSADALDNFLARLNGEARVDNVLIIAGDRDESGPFRSALDAIDSGLLRRRGIRGIGIAGYPDGHPRIGDEELNRALRDKIAAAEALDLAPPDCMMVAAHSSDLAAAAALGLRTAHIACPDEDGPGRGEAAPSVPVDIAAKDLEDLAAQLAV